MTVRARVAGVGLLFCDVVGSTALGVELGEAANDELRRDLFEALRQPLRAFQGREVKNQGDGLMVSFTSSMSEVLGCAVAMQRSVARLDGADGAPPLSIRIGVSSGEATSEDGDWFGTPVIEAARLCALAAPGQIVVADHALVDLGSRAPPISASGPTQLKGFTTPIDCSVVEWEPGDHRATIAPLPSPLDVTGHPDVAGVTDILSRGAAVWRDVLAGETRALLVAGPPRAGRTRYAAELVRAAATGADPIGVVYGAPGQAEPAGSVFADALRRFVRWAPETVAVRLAAVDGMNRLVPAVDVRLGRRPSPAVARMTSQDEVSSVVIAAVRSISDVGPLIVVLDDMQWANTDTIDTLVDLVTSELGRVLVVATFRTTSDDNDTYERVREKTRGLAAIGGMELGPMREADVGSIIAQQFEHREIHRAVAPRIVIEAVGGLAGDVVDAARRLGALPPGASDRAIRDALSVCVPYKGLVPLGPDDATVFFGRDDLVERLGSRLRSKRFVAVTGPSGSGKSSLLQAGVANEFSHSGGLVAVLNPRDDELLPRLRSVADAGGGIVVDQFEQLFTLWSAPRRDAFLDDLLDVVDFSEAAWVAIGLRSDFFGRCAEHPRLAERLSDATALIGRLTETELRTIVERPAEAASLTLEPGLVDVVLADLVGEPSPLPLLSHALFETWRRRRLDLLTVADYHDAGGVRRSIARTAERVYLGEFDPGEQHMARALLLRLVELGDDGPPTRHPMRLDEIVGMFGDDIAPVLEVLVTARLVVVDEDRAELAHEALLTEWPRLVDWLDDDRERLRAMAHLARAAHDWDAQDRPESELYRGGRLDSALDLAARGVPMTPVEHAFTAAGAELRDAEQVRLHRTNRRLRRQLTGALLALTLAAVAVGVAVVQQRSADSARAVATDQRRAAEVALLAGNARSLADSEVDTAALLAIEAHRLAPSGATLGTIGTVLRAQPTIIGSVYAEFLAPNSTIVARSFDRSTVVFASEGALIPVDTTTLQPHPSIDVGREDSAALSADGTRLAIVVGRSLHVVSVHTGENLSTTALTGNATSSTNGHITWLDDSHLVISPSHPGDVISVDIATGAVTRGFSLDEGNLVTATPDDGAILSVPEVRPPGSDRGIALHRDSTHEPAESIALIEGATRSLWAEFAPGGRFLVVGTNAGLQLIDRDLDEPVAIPGQRAVSTTGAFSADGSRLMTIDNSGNVVEYDLDDADGPVEIARQHIGGAHDGFFTSDADMLYAVDGNRFVKISLAGEQPLATAPLGTPSTVPLTVFPDGNQVYAGDPSDGSVDRWRTDTTTRSESQLGTRVVPWFIDPSGHWTLAVDHASLSFLTITTDGDEIAHERFSPTAGVSTDLAASILVTMKSGSTTPEVRRLPSLETVPTPLTMSGVDDVWIVVSDDGRLIAWVGLDDDGDQRLDIGNLVTGEVLSTSELAPDVAAVTAGAFSPDGSAFVLGDAAGQTTSVDVSTGQRRSERYPSNGSSIMWLGYLHDGDMLVAVDKQGQFSAWDTTTRAAVWEPLESNRTQDFDAALMASDWTGTFWAITDDDGMRVWNLDFDAWPSIACARAGRNLTRDEWSTYLPEGEPYHTTCADFAPGA